MKVLCICSDWEYTKKWDRFMQFIFGRNHPDPVYGNIYNVIGEESNDYYVLEEFAGNGGYEKDCFIPISEIDETEFERQIIKEKV